MESVAPWAEPVLMTADELLQLTSDKWRYELVDGRLVRLSPTGREHGRVVMALLRAIDRFVEDRGLGEVLLPETGFWISHPGEPDTVLAPDIAFVRQSRQSDPPGIGYPRLAPDLVVEVASPSQGRREMAAKAQRWLDAGVSLVWVVLPETRIVEVWHDGALKQVLSQNDDLSGQDVLPGFVFAARLLFP